MKYRKKPIVIEAWQFDGAQYPAAAPFVWSSEGLFIDTLEGRMRVDVGDWVITGVKGEVYPCKPDIFDATYEPAFPERTEPQ